jgi:ribulose 1,5-bisphosphate synthetase/thiazole synthase
LGTSLARRATARGIEEPWMENWQREADVVVIGAGATGLPAAI